jgi:carbohydrate diacid regulator
MATRQDTGTGGAGGAAVAPFLTPTLAQEIAEDTSRIVGFNVLVTDRDGRVIGSGDASRVGAFHEASVEVMATGQPATHSAAAARALDGVRPGVTFPLVLDGEAIGTVGITGAPSRVRRFGLVVQRQTEILLRESLLLHSRLLHERALEDLVRDLASFDSGVVAPELVAFRASEMGYDLTLPRVAVVVHVVDPGTPTREPLRPALLRAVRRVFADPQDVVAGTASGRFVVLHRVPPEGEDLTGACHRLVTEMHRRVGVGVTVGVGGAGAGVPALHESYADASDALHLGDREGAGQVLRIEDLRVPQVLASVGRRARQRFTDAVGEPLRQHPDHAVLRATVVAWCEHGFSLVRTAEALHVHRNTLVHRLRRLEQVTGVASRDHRAMLALYLACLLDPGGERP